MVLNSRLTYNTTIDSSRSISAASRYDVQRLSRLSCTRYRSRRERDFFMSRQHWNNRWQSSGVVYRLAHIETTPAQLFLPL